VQVTYLHFAGFEHRSTRSTRLWKADSQLRFLRANVSSQRPSTDIRHDVRICLPMLKPPMRTTVWTSADDRNKPSDSNSARIKLIDSYVKPERALRIGSSLSSRDARTLLMPRRASAWTRNTSQRSSAIDRQGTLSVTYADVHDARTQHESAISKALKIFLEMRKKNRALKPTRRPNRANGPNRGLRFETSET
jgi:hypothetical protein